MEICTYSLISCFHSCRRTEHGQLILTIHRVVIRHIRGDGTTTRVALEGIRVFSISRFMGLAVPFAKRMASLVVSAMAESIVKVLPKPISSAKIPPPVSEGLSATVSPVITWVYLQRVSTCIFFIDIITQTSC
jgi:hypothetical protein